MSTFYVIINIKVSDDMSIEIREAKSSEIKKHIKVVKKMTSNMKFNENMDKVNWKLVRFFSNIGYMFMPKEKEVTYKKLKINGVNGILVTPNNIENNDDFILYIHGGGFVSGSAKGTKGYCSMLAKYSKCRVITIDYSLAPEKPYPNGLNDVYNYYLGLKEKYPNCKIALIGESGGANLCIATTIRLINNKKETPPCVVVHSPIIDLSGRVDRNYKINDFTVRESSLKPLQKMYGGENNITDPEISPIYFKKYNKFPSIFITCDYNETLRADSEELYNKCIEGKVESKLIIMKNTFHSFATIGTSSPETKIILKENCDFINKSFKN